MNINKLTENFISTYSTINEYSVIAEYITPNGKELLLSSPTVYVILACTLRGYTYLLNKIPSSYKGSIIIPTFFADVKTGKHNLTLQSENNLFSSFDFEVKKSNRYDFNIIDSKKNNVYAELKKAESLSFRKENNCFILEEERLVKRAIDDNLNIRYIVYTQKSTLISDNSIERAKNAHIPCFLINEGLMGSLTQTRPIPRELAFCTMPQYSIDSISFAEKSTILIADNVENPDNLGLVIRTADACGADAVIYIGELASIYNKNSIRASRGAMGRFPIFEFPSARFDEISKKLKANGYLICGSSAKTQNTAADLDSVSKKVFLVSNETHGISDHAAKCCDKMVKIPMASGQSSLNVAVAAGIILSSSIKFS